MIPILVILFIVVVVFWLHKVWGKVLKQISHKRNFIFWRLWTTVPCMHTVHMHNWLHILELESQRRHKLTIPAEFQKWILSLGNFIFRMVWTTVPRMHTVHRHMAFFHNWLHVLELESQFEDKNMQLAAVSHKAKLKWVSAWIWKAANGNLVSFHALVV